MSDLPALLTPGGLLLWYGWNVLVLASIQLTVRLIMAFSIPTTLLGAAAQTAGSIPITLVYVRLLGGALDRYPFAMLLTGLLGFAIARRVLRIKRLRGQVVAAAGAALLAGPWPVFLEPLR